MFVDVRPIGGYSRQYYGAFFHDSDGDVTLIRKQKRTKHSTACADALAFGEDHEITVYQGWHFEDES